MTTLREAAQQALEALESTSGNINPERGYVDELENEVTAATKALRAALEQPEQPVAWMVYTQDGKSVCVTDNPADFIEWRSFPLYTHPPRREWRGLKEWEINAATFHPDGRMNTHLEFARAVEAALRSKNHE